MIGCSSAVVHTGAIVLALSKDHSGRNINDGQPQLRNDLARLTPKGLSSTKSIL